MVPQYVSETGGIYGTDPMIAQAHLSAATTQINPI
jgi:hypothetical protein